MNIEELFKNHNKEILRYFYLRTKDKNISEDLTSEVFFRIIKYRDSYKSERSSIRTWIYRIANNILIDFYKDSTKNGIKRSFEELDELISEEELSEVTLLKEFLENSFRKLEDDEQELMILRFVNELSFSEIAEIKKIGNVNVRVKLFRIQKKLKKILNE